MNTTQKCEAILKQIVGLNQDINNKQGVSFTPDWAGNSLTIETKDGHSHCGDPDGSFKRLINELHSLLCEGRGLSFEKKQPNQINQ